jgi:hypothetical protein
MDMLRRRNAPAVALMTRYLNPASMGPHRLLRKATRT